MMLYVLGCPGSGKGTLCSKLAKKAGLSHISVGDVLRDYDGQTEAANDILKECVQSGTLVPAEHLASVLHNHLMILREQGHHSFIVDGFPRKLDQLEHIQSVFGPPDLVLFFDCPGRKAKKRVIERNIESRVDNEDLFDRRYQELCENNPSIVEHFEKSGLLRRIDTLG